MWRKIGVWAVPVVLVVLLVVSVHAGAVPAAVVGGGSGSFPVVTVTIVSVGFDPPVVTVPVRTGVVWVNADLSAHTVTALRGEFSSGLILPGGTYSFLFVAPGEYPYRDLLSSATGKVVVGEGVYRVYFPLILRDYGGEQ